MGKLAEFFTPLKIRELETDLKIEFVPYVQGAGWEVNRLHYQSREKPAFARQALQVNSKREALAKLSVMIEELKAMGIQEKLEEIRNFARDNDIDSMVDFCAWGDGFDQIESIVDTDPESSAMRWMASNHNC